MFRPVVGEASSLPPDGGFAEHLIYCSTRCRRIPAVYFETAGSSDGLRKENIGSEVRNSKQTRCSGKTGRLMPLE